MINIQTLTPDDKTVRTQIILTLALKKAVEDVAESRGESLSEYLRKAAMIRLLLEKEETDDLKSIAKRVVGSIRDKNHSNWSTKEQIYKWSRKIREEW